MKTVELIVPLALALALAACDKAGTPPKPTTSSTDSASSGSVAQAPSALPPSDATMKPVAPAASTTSGSGNAATPTQANPAPLTREQEQSTLPHTGQVNNHSTPDTTSAK